MNEFKVYKPKDSDYWWAEIEPSCIPPRVTKYTVEELFQLMATVASALEVTDGTGHRAGEELSWGYLEGQGPEGK